MGVISAGKAYNIAYEEGKKRLYSEIERAAQNGEMYYNADTSSLTQDTIDELKEAGYEISPMLSYTKISWKNFNSKKWKLHGAFNQ